MPAIESWVLIASAISEVSDERARTKQADSDEPACTK